VEPLRTAAGIQTPTFEPRGYCGAAALGIKEQTAEMHASASVGKKAARRNTKKGDEEDWEDTDSDKENTPRKVCFLFVTLHCTV